ncbi:MAG: hypothetical protein AB4911_24335 [Oscillochloridaceae bacterium umkhey_bin13]
MSTPISTAIPATPTIPAAVIASDIALSEAYESFTSRLTLQYPDGWTIQGIRFGALPVVSNYRLYNGTSPEFNAAPGEVVMTIIDPVRLIESLRVDPTKPLLPEEALDLWQRTAPAEFQAGVYATTIARFNERMFISREYTTETLDAVVYMLQSSDKYLTQVTAFMAPGELANFRDEILAIASTIDYQAPSRDLLAGTPAEAVAAYLAHVSVGEDPGDRLCVQDRIFGRLVSLWQESDESTYGNISRLVNEKIELLRDQIAIDYSQLFLETFYEKDGEALVSISGSVRVTDGVTEVFIPFSQVDPLAQVLPVVQENGWAVCQTRLITGMATISNEPDELRPVNTPKIYWYDRAKRALLRADLDGKNVELITKIEGDVEDIAIDPSSQRSFWLGTHRSGDALMSAPLDRTSGSPVLCTFGFQECERNGPFDMPRGLAFDIKHDRIYWGDVWSNAIYRANADGTDIEIVYDGGRRIQDIFIDNEHDLLYWAEPKPLSETNNQAVSAIFRASLDGENKEELGSLPESVIAIAVGRNAVYIAVNQPYRIVRLDLVSGDVRDVVTGIRSLRSIAVDPLDDTIFWGSRSSLYRSDADGQNPREIYSASRAYDVVLDLTLDLSSRTTP